MELSAGMAGRAEEVAEGLTTASCFRAQEVLTQQCHDLWYLCGLNLLGLLNLAFGLNSPVHDNLLLLLLCRALQCLQQ